MLTHDVVQSCPHPEIAQCLRMLARLNYIMGEHVEALGYQQKAVFMSERVNGIDHPYTITEYVSVNLKDQIKYSNIALNN
jgi:protein TIF31